MNWLMQLPRRIFVAIVLLGGVLFIVLSDPPRTVCDAQYEVFDEETRGFFSADPSKPHIKGSRYKKLKDICEAQQTPGVCLELFTSLRAELDGIRAISPECYGKVADHAGFETALWGTIDLMIRLAWGKQPPASPAVRTGWFTTADLFNFCLFKKVAVDFWGENRWNSFATAYYQSLPGAPALGNNEAWSRMLASVNCQSFE